MRVAVAVLLALVAIACGEDPMPKLEAELASLLEQTRPKAEFWVEVERNGALLEQRRGIEQELAEVNAKMAPLASERDQLASALAQARAMNQQIEVALAANRAELARLEAEVAVREATLAGFESRRRAPEQTP